MTPTDRLEHHGREIRKEIRTAAAPEDVWRAWTDPELIAGWFVDRASGKMEEGETYTWFWDYENIQAPMTVAGAEPGRWFALRAETPIGTSLLEVRIEREEGETVIRLVQSGFGEGAEWDDEYSGTDWGWTLALGLLRHYLERRFGRKRRDTMVRRQVPVDFDELRPLYREEGALSRWLTKGGSIGEPGAALSLELRDGSKLTGEVLAEAGPEVAIGWEEIGGVLELKAWGSLAGGRWVALRLSSWELDPARLAEVEGFLGEALDRLVGLLEPADASSVAPAPV